MAEFITDIITPNQLTTAVQEATRETLPFEPIIPSVQTDNLRQQIASVDLSASSELARYRNWETVPDIGRRPGFTLEEYEIAPLGHSYRLNEEDLMKLSQVRQGLAANGVAQELAEVLFNDAVRAANAVEDRITITHAELLQFGVVTLDELGNPATPASNAVKVTFPVPNDHLNVTPIGDDWSVHATADPAADLRAWETEYRSNNRGRNPDRWGISSEILGDLMMNAKLIGLTYPNATALPGMLQAPQVAQALRMAGVQAPLAITNDAEGPKLDGTFGRLISNRVVIGMQAGMARTYFAPPPVLAVMPGNATLERRDARGIIAYSTSEVRPPVVLTTAEAVALPLLERPSALFVATV